VIYNKKGVNVDKPTNKYVANLGSNGGVVEFDSTTDARAWVDAAYGQFEWISQYANAEPPLNSLWSNIRSNYKNLIRRLDQINNSGTADTESLWKDFIAELESIYQTPRLIHFSSTRGKLVLKKKEQNASIAAYMLMYFLGIDAQPTNSNFVRGAIEASMVDAGLKPDSTSDALMRLEQAELSLQELASEFRSDAAKLAEAFDATLSERVVLNTSQREQFQKQIDDSAKQMALEIDASKARLKEFEKTYDEKLSLLAPVNYWRTQQRRHWQMALVFGAVSIFVAVAGGIALYAFSNELLDAIGKVTQKTGKTVSLLEVPISLLSVLFLGVLIFVWIERILIRITLSHVHLRTDAAERVVMINTYLALLREGTAIPDDQRSLVLGSIFRPSTTGVVSDDAAPAFWDALTRQGSK
jgi:hypothetical protein